ncbi:uncharacterized protein LOC129769411 isoform X3 [Toxorhynchites rutilus septentrionalis]|uniref:uncharacterized protein LOC129769411 isoform X3 n=1 Tax=Toxorhynchites rutilus septentrionalis TaxID=329112 RepID=UPI002479DF0F|nr:uncharacterized protein LOC129769411 isoform X3 [Toxorhynchites rutilus septentrionalis]XP_055627663.1 uncharacterized protein LOC129769411 isoform X3 [Toxorhynchites rutilus septentrionalis]
MKFGHYNLTTETVHRSHLFSFRLKKVKSTASYLIDKVHRKLGTTKVRMHQRYPDPAVESTVMQSSPRSDNPRRSPRKIATRSESPLSYRASLFDERHIHGSSRPKSIASRTRFSPQDFPTSWFGGVAYPFDPSRIIGQDEAFQVFNHKAHLFHKNKTISGRRPLFAKNFQPFNSLQRESSLAKKHIFNSCPEINAGTLKSQISQRSKNSQKSQKSYKSSKSSWRFKSKIVQLLERNNDEKTEMDILQEYFDTMSYSEIIKDKDFKNYLIKKQYLDIMDYIYNSSGSEFGLSEGQSRAPSLPVSNNDCDSVKKEKLLAENPKKYYSHTNSQVFCKRDKNFERYYQKYGSVPAGESRVFGYSSLPTQYYPFNPLTVRKKEDIPCYVTLPKRRSRCMRTYQQVRDFCEKSLLKYTSSKPTNETLKLQKASKEYSEKAYNKVTREFVRKRGFDNVEEYIQYYYGDFLNQKPFRTRKINQFNSLPPPPYSSGEFHDEQFRSLDSKPPTARTTPSAVLANDSGVDCNSNLNSLIYSDSFKNFDYVNLATMNMRNRKSSSACCQLNEKPRIFRLVGSDDEDEDEDRFTSHVLLDGLIATSNETNLPYIFDDIGIYESIKSTEKERFRAEVRSRKDSLIERNFVAAETDPVTANPKAGFPLRGVAHGKKLLNERATAGCDAPTIARGYRDEMQSEEMSSLVPPGLQGKADILFGNLHELYTFHNDIFLKDLENCISTTELVALCFVQRRDTFFRLYSYYCQNIPRSERLRETLVDTHLFLQECQKKLGHKLPLAAYLLKPVQRITKYQLLLKDLLKFSDTGTCSRELQKALDCMLVVLKCVNDSMHQIAITGFPADLSQQGELLLQDSFQVWTESKKDLRLRLKTQHRHIFLYQKAMLFCKQGSKTGHNKSTYQFKHWLQMSQIGLTESVRGDPRRFEVWLQGRQEVHTIQANTIDIKNKWVAEIKRVLLNQLEELKGEKIKQYGLNHKHLHKTTSWDVPQAIHGMPNRTFSCDQQSVTATVGNIQHLGGQEVITRISHLTDDGMMSAAGISSSSSEHDNQDTSAWSSDYSNSEDEFTHGEDGALPGHKFVSLADYCAMGNSEVSMKEGDIVELLKIGCAGWWFVKTMASGLEGWAPAAYLEPLNRKASRLRSARSQDKLNDH